MQSQSIVLKSHHPEADATDVFGFWLYIMTDCILFASLFAVFLVLNREPMSMGGMVNVPTLKKYIDLWYTLGETFLLLASNFTFCLATLALHHGRLRRTQGWLLLTFLLGMGFVIMELREFYLLAQEGFRWDISGQASSFFTLVGTHGLHVSIGLIWIALMIVQLPILNITSITVRRMTYLGLFWNFLDIVWIFLFSIVYLMGAL